MNKRRDLMTDILQNSEWYSIDTVNHIRNTTQMSYSPKLQGLSYNK